MTARSGPLTEDVVGVGFGPSNLALAIALEESAGPASGNPGVGMRFFERQEEFGWHRGMLMEGATMQVSFLKDLATMRNPASAYTFVSYLKAKGRMAEFINSKTLFPLRVEFHDYLEWVAEQFASVVSYASDITGIRPVVENGAVEYLDILARTSPGAAPTVVSRARNVVIGAGLSPRMPAGVEESDRIWHSSRLLHRTAALTRAPRTVVVVGSGQSAAEAADYLHRTFPGAEVNAVLSRYGYSVADDSPFVNGIFDPDAVGQFYSAPQDVKQTLIGYHSNTNYSVVDLDLSQELYRRIYQEKVLGTQRFKMLNAARATAAEEHADGVRVTVDSLAGDSSRVIDADVVVYATGYRPSDPLPLFRELLADCKRDGEGRLVVGRDYRVTTSDAVRCGIYLQGASTEHSHGLAAGLLSNTAVRSGEIAASILKG
ncbi:lysine N(6)-hydroxylase/L-ornithine N(5)-oxygenase family protein [Streptomyces flavotricini]|uniref:L-lysine N6-monooxygenase MbtG n=1 Tax=Streptomyces flavotricini TaxID=66888 RepID=A0ABS8E2S9_9ACTN|nr:SidA/IucD/PvdA family monooxygenase [Streptomyces flavotricini]MCC0095441.1 lysine N(6)-hydroxylase/L-ornithine N(5)-oxygenase family protein [Streptomyces flavotricini]